MADYSFAVLKQQADELGLAGEDAVKYVLNQQAAGRDERAKEREFLSGEREVQIARWEAEKAKLELEKEKVKSETELEVARLGGSRSAPPVYTEGVVRPTLPVYKDGEDVAGYLTRFERVAALLDLNKASYAVRLGSLLTGKAAEVYIISF